MPGRAGGPPPHSALAEERDYPWPCRDHGNTAKSFDELVHGGPALDTMGTVWLDFPTGTLEAVPAKDQQALKRQQARWLTDAAQAGLDEEGIATPVASTLHDLRQGNAAKAS